MRLSPELLTDIIEAQLTAWPAANTNYAALAGCERRLVRIGDLDVVLQFNPARAVSTAAKVDKASIAKRQCFLCAAHRPKEQVAIDCPEGWDFLVNPFPIFPVHFTIAAREHTPQRAVPPDMASLAEQLPGVAVFYNGARAGASAPDHLHFQAVLKDELPLLRLVEKRHPLSETGIRSSRQLGIDIPFGFFSAVITPDEEGLKDMARMLTVKGLDNETSMPDTGLVNAYFWTEAPGSLLRIVMVPRGAHRPPCYGSDKPGQHLVSPGAVDMAGVIILPRREDFDSLSDVEIHNILAFTGVVPDLLPF